MTEKEKILRDAKRRLKIAGIQVYESARGMEPFVASKFLNVLGKEIQQLSMELAVFLNPNEWDVEKINWEIRKQPSLALLKKLIEEERRLEKRRRT